jgi:acyl transferase domain-containing protein
MELLPGTLSLAAVNSSDECVVSGPAEAVDATGRTLADREVTGLRIPLARPPHSSLWTRCSRNSSTLFATVSLRHADDALVRI